MAESSLALEYLRRLLPPLVYGARDGFAHLHTLGRLEPMVKPIAREAWRAGADRELVKRIVDRARAFDTGDLAARRHALTDLARELASVIDLPEPLRPLIERRSEPPTQAEAEAAPPRKKAAQKREAEDARKAGTGAGKASKPASRRRKPAAAPPEDSLAAESEVVYPSIAPMSGPLTAPLSSLAPIRGKLASSLRDRRITKVGDALFYFPRAYEDRREILPIARLQPGTRGVSRGEVKRVEEVVAGRRRLFKVVLGDRTGTIAATWYHYHPWMRKRFQVGDRFLFSGEVRAFAGGREIAHPDLEPAEGAESDPASFGRIVPIYPGLDHAEQRGFRTLVQQAAEKHWERVEDPLPSALLGRLGLPPLGQAIREVHFPAGVEPEVLAAHGTPAQRRLAFDELFLIQLGLALRRKGVKLKQGIQFQVDEAMKRRALARLPFAMTGAQRRAFEEIAEDMAKPEPMNRLLLGDVGSGKTAVAAVAACIAVENGHQAAIMAPTEILAEQHFRTLSRWLDGPESRVGLLTASVPKKEKETTKAAIADGSIRVVVGTHALLQEDVAFESLGFAVIDEQHRFGVLQRAGLMRKAVLPDVLVMTATPIPRTLSMALYGDLDQSVIDELPPGRTPVKTRVFSQRVREKALSLVRAELEKGRQAYVVYPLVEESEKSDLASATQGAQELAERFPRHRVGLVHGRMKADEKDAVMAAFRAGEVHLLVSTTVIEVGVDVPNATVMVVEAAERFGLSQLHQLRGRVGRGAEASYCLLLAKDWRNEVAVRRLGIMEKTTNGFEIAQEDLRIRGPGEFLGTRQSGVPGLVLADLTRDHDLLASAKREAWLLADSDPRLERPEHALLRLAVDARWEGKLGLARVG